jgi:hypothetical protein
VRVKPVSCPKVNWRGGEQDGQVDEKFSSFYEYCHGRHVCNHTCGERTSQVFRSRVYPLPPPSAPGWRETPIYAPDAPTAAVLEQSWSAFLNVRTCASR